MTVEVYLPILILCDRCNWKQEEWNMSAKLGSERTRRKQETYSPPLFQLMLLHLLSLLPLRAIHIRIEPIHHRHMHFHDIMGTHPHLSQARPLFNDT